MNLSKNYKTVLWVNGAMRELHSLGMIECKDDTMTTRGMFEYDKLLMQGFKPSTEHIIQAVNIMKIVNDDNKGHETLIKLLISLRDRREHIENYALKHGYEKY